jgi:hypothetical protein
MKRYQKALPALLGILALLVGAWSFAPQNTALGQTVATPSASGRSLSFPPGLSANQKALLQAQYDFNPDISSITPGSLVGADRTALDVMWAQNNAALQMTRLAISRARNSQVRAEARLMYQMLSKDQALLNQLEAQVGPVAGTPTPVATLTGTSTPVATTAPTSSATAVETSLPTEAATTEPTTAATIAPTEAATTEPTTAATIVPTEAATTEPTAAATESATAAATIASTAAVTEEPTLEASGTPEATVEGTLSASNRGGGGSAPVSLNNVPILPDTILDRLGFHWINLNGVYLNKVNRLSNSQFDLGFVTQVATLENMAIDTDRVVQTTSTNPVLQGVAKHLYEEYGLNLVMLQILGDRVFFGQSLTIHFPTPPGQSTPAGTESATPGDQSGSSEVH